MTHGAAECPAPVDLVPALVARLEKGSTRPLVVLDPGWPDAMRARAHADVGDAVAAGRLTGDDLVLFTSGSSGSPRAVVRTLESWRASLAPLTEITGIGSDVGPELVWVPGPLTSSLFLYGAMHAAWSGLRWTAGRPDVPRVQPVTSAHLVPTHLADALDAREQGLLRNLRTVVVAGAHLSAALRERAERHGLRVVEYYGSAELSFVGWRDDGGPFRSFLGAEVTLEPERAGDVAEGSDSARSRESSAGAADGAPATHSPRHPTPHRPAPGTAEPEAGALWVRSPYVARDYLRPDPNGPWRRRGGWHTVGDLARPAGTGWWLLGRGATAVTTGGHTVVVQAVERVLGQVPGVADVVVLGLPHERLGEVVTAVVRATSHDGPELREGLRDAARALPVPARPRRWLRADDLPLLPSGKVDRAAVRDAAAAGTLASL